MKKFMFAAVAAAGIAAVSIGASVTIDGVSWTYKVLNSSAGYVMLGGGTSEKPALAKTVQLNADSIPWTFEDRGRLYTVTEVGPYAFNECLIEGTLNIPPSVKKIGNRAFRKCSGIIQLDGMTNVTSVAEYAFFMCDNMASSSSSLHLEKASLLTGAFSGCSKFMNAQGSIMSVKNGTATLHPDLFKYRKSSTLQLRNVLLFCSVQLLFPSMLPVRGPRKENEMQIKFTLTLELTARKQIKRKVAQPPKQTPQINSLIKIIRILRRFSGLDRGTGCFDSLRTAFPSFGKPINLKSIKT